jgi:glyoxylase-like metal-dependent hydrolase (beta-lactamase superfamily II)
LSGAISTHLIAGDTPVLVDPGPTTTLGALEAGLKEVGLAVTDLHTVLLTHVHLDHAGVVGHLAQMNPDLNIVVHEDGAPHLVDPKRLVASTRRTFGARHDELWGEVLPVPSSQVTRWKEGDADPVKGISVLPAPGHIAHHLVYFEEDSGTLFAGDALGIILVPGAQVHPPTPPPGVDIEAWRETLRTLRAVGARRARIHHFGVHNNIVGLADALEKALCDLEARARRASKRGELALERERDLFEAESRAAMRDHRSRDDVDTYFDIFRASNDLNGVVRWVESR